MNAAHALRHADVEVTLVDKHNYHTFQPLLYQVSTGYLPAEEVGAALRSVFRRQRNLTVRVATVACLDNATQQLRLQDGSSLSFDYLILAAGAETNFFGIDGMADHGWPLYTLPDAVQLRTHLLETFERVAQTDPTGAARTTVVVVGGGPTGVETAAALTSMAQDVVGPVATLQVVLVEAGPRLLAAFSQRSSARALRDLRRRGVDVRLNRTVQSADANGITLDGDERIQAGTAIWAAGVRANQVGRALGLDLGRQDRVVVNSSLQAAGHPNVFVAGDLAGAGTSQSGGSLPMLAPVAIQTGRHAGKQVARAVGGRSLAAFRYRDKGMMAVLGRGDAVAELPLRPGTDSSHGYPLRFGGLPAWLLWVIVHIVYLIGFRNRIKVLLDWGWSYFTSRGAGAILVRQSERPSRSSPTDGERSPQPRSAHHEHGRADGS